MGAFKSLSDLQQELKALHSTFFLCGHDLGVVGWTQGIRRKDEGREDDAFNAANLFAAAAAQARAKLEQQQHSRQ